MISVQVPDVVAEQITAVARSRGQSRFAVVREAITQIASEAEPAAIERHLAGRRVLRAGLADPQAPPASGAPVLVSQLKISAGDAVLLALWLSLGRGRRR